MPKCLPEHRLLTVFKVILMPFLLCVGVFASKLLVPFIGADLPKWPELWRKFTRNDLEKREFFCVLHFAPILNILKDCISQCLHSLVRSVLSNTAHYLYPDDCLYGQRGCQSLCIFQEESLSPFFPLNYAHWTFPPINLSKIHLF